MVGRIPIFKTMALSKILYIATLKAPSKLILDELALMVTAVTKNKTLDSHWRLFRGRI